MGECVSKTDSNETNNHQQVKSVPPPVRKQYSSKLIDPRIQEVIIQEEESYMNQSSVLTFYENTLAASLSKSQMLNSFQKSKPLGRQINQDNAIQLINVINGRKLHSHALKCSTGSKQHEVVLCNDVESDYDQWLFQKDSDGPIRDNDIIVIQHKLTRCILRSSSSFKNKTKTQQVCCVSKDISDDDYWRIEILSESKLLQINAVISILSFNIQGIIHVQSNGYLSTTKNKATLKQHFEITISTNPDIWIIEDIL
ncbi:hypothetical protein pb186bvf_012172 [Paramecium bursaria]